MVVNKEESLELLEARMKLSPEGLLFARLADGYRKKGDIAQAIDICKQGIGKHPSYVTGRIILGRCYLEQEKFAEAITEFTSVCRLDRRNQVALKVLADIFAKQQFTDKAGDLYATLAKNDPENKSLSHLAGTIKGTGRDDIFAVIGIKTPEFKWPVSGQMEQQPEPSSEQLDDLPSFGTGPESNEPVTADNMPFSNPVAETEILEEFTEDAPPINAAGAHGAAINDRMAQMFEDEAATHTESFDITAAAADQPFRPTDDDDNRLFAEPTTPGGRALDGEVSGSDVSNRIQDLFGESSVAADDLFAEPVSGMHETAYEETSHGSEISQPDFGGMSTTDLLDEVASADTPDFDSLPEDSVPDDKKGSEIALTADSAIIGIEDTVVSLMGSTASIEPEETVLEGEIISDQDVTGADVSNRLDSIFTTDTVPASAPVQGDETQAIPADEVAEAVNSFDETLSFSLASDLIGSGAQATDTLSRAAGPDTDELFGEEPLMGADHRSTPPPHPVVEPPLLRSGAPTGLITESGDAFIEEMAKAETTVINSVSSDQVSGDDVVGKIDELFGSTADEDAEGPEIERKLGDTDYFEIKTETEDTLGQTLAWDREKLLGTQPVRAAPPSSSAPAGESIVLDEFPASLDSLPDDDTDTGSAGEYYTVSGDNAENSAPPAADDQTLAAIELDITPGTSHNIFLDEELASDTAIVPVEAEFSSSDQPDGVADTAFVSEAQPSVTDGLFLNKPAAILSDDLAPSADTIPDNDAEDTAATGDFYTVSGEDAGRSSNTDSVQGGLDIIELEAPVTTPMEDIETAAAEDGLNAETVFQAVEVEPGKPVFSTADPDDSAMYPSTENRQEEASAAKAIYSIPDHVLTPTLADIYFRQGQPQLAVQIYRRLLELDPDNEKITERIASIDALLKSQPSETTPNVSFKGGKMMAEVSGPTQKGRPGRKKKVRSAVPKPLEGIRIKKKVREQFKRKKKI